MKPQSDSTRMIKPWEKKFGSRMSERTLINLANSGWGGLKVRVKLFSRSVSECTFTYPNEG